MESSAYLRKLYLNSSSSQGGILRHPAAFGFRLLFYAVTPNETSFEKPDDVPDYLDQVVPFFMVMVVLESIVLSFQGKRRSMPRWADSFSSLAAGMIASFPLLFVRNIEISSYMWVSERYRVVDLPWQSPWVWMATMLGVDFFYYWAHRGAHEINCLWAGHQVHHSSEHYNLTTALRQSVLQRYGTWIFYIPLAFFMPCTVFMVHIHLNTLFQFWIHTESIRTLGPLEMVLNTPSHHRVHHGRNRYAIDKNYAGLLIIWDRMFGTFEEENPKDEVVYGLTKPLNSWNPVYTQFCHWMHIVRTMRELPGVRNKLWVLLKGPGWAPGKPRLGLIEDIQDIHAPIKRFSSHPPLWLNLYSWLHFALSLIILVSVSIKQRDQELSPFHGLAAIIFILWTITNIGYIFEERDSAAKSEFIRCVACLVGDMVFSGLNPAPLTPEHLLLRAVFLLSTLAWLATWGSKRTIKIKEN